MADVNAGVSHGDVVAMSREQLVAEVVRLRATRASVREAHRHGFWAWAGPANIDEYAELESMEAEAWQGFLATREGTGNA